MGLALGPKSHSRRWDQQSWNIFKKHCGLGGNVAERSRPRRRASRGNKSLARPRRAARAEKGTRFSGEHRAARAAANMPYFLMRVRPCPPLSKISTFPPPRRSPIFRCESGQLGAAGFPWPTSARRAPTNRRRRAARANRRSRKGSAPQLSAEKYGLAAQLNIALSPMRKAELGGVQQRHCPQSPFPSPQPPVPNPQSPVTRPHHQSPVPVPIPQSPAPIPQSHSPFH